MTRDYRQLGSPGYCFRTQIGYCFRKRIPWRGGSIAVCVHMPASRFLCSPTLKAGLAAILRALFACLIVEVRQNAIVRVQFFNPVVLDAISHGILVEEVVAHITVESRVGDRHVISINNPVSVREPTGRTLLPAFSCEVEDDGEGLDILDILVVYEADFREYHYVSVVDCVAVLVVLSQTNVKVTDTHTRHRPALEMCINGNSIIIFDVFRPFKYWLTEWGGAAWCVVVKHSLYE
mmetsp:Transcript_33659/g.65016  ORF Transcript_33659/g.65016 Transcript_33659/m.65016 type:complete len:235 (-) Transcript_33659:131-835(-)